MSAERRCTCKRRITRRNRALGIDAGRVSACCACLRQREPMRRSHALEAADVLGFLSTREAVRIQRRYHAA